MEQRPDGSHSWSFATGGSAPDVTGLKEFGYADNNNVTVGNQWQDWDWEYSIQLEEDTAGSVNQAGHGLAVHGIPGAVFDPYPLTYSTGYIDRIANVEGMGISLRILCRPVPYRIWAYAELEDVVLPSSEIDINFKLARRRFSGRKR